MSTIVVLKENNTLILGTDSRVMKHDWSCVVSDAEPKIIQVAPETFIATSGYMMTCEFQHQKARELARQLGTTNIRVIDKALEWESLAYLQELAGHLPSAKDLGGAGIDPVISGEKLLHGCAFAGRNADGKLGYITHEYRLRAGRVVNERSEYFGAKRQIYNTTGELVLNLAHDPATWTDGPVRVVRRFLSALKRANPHIGGRDQILLLDRSGEHWISRLPELAAAGFSEA